MSKNNNNYYAHLSAIIPEIGIPMNCPKLWIDPTVDSFHLFSSHMSPNCKNDKRVSIRYINVIYFIVYG